MWVFELDGFNLGRTVREMPLDGWTACAFSRDGELMAFSGPTGLRILRVSTGVPELTARTGGTVLTAAPDGDGFLTGPKLRIWSVAHNGVEREIPFDVHYRFSADPAAVKGEPWWAAQLVTDPGGPRNVQFMDLNEPSALLTLEIDPGPVSLLHDLPRPRLGPRGRVLAIIDEAGVSLWDVHDKLAPRPLHVPLRLVPPSEQVVTVVFSPSGETCAVVTGPQDDQGTAIWAEVTLYAVDSGAVLATRRIDAGVSALDFSADGHGLMLAVPGCRDLLYCRD